MKKSPKFKIDDVVMVRLDTRSRINYGYIVPTYKVKKINAIYNTEDGYYYDFYQVPGMGSYEENIMGTYKTVYMRDYDYAEI